MTNETRRLTETPAQLIAFYFPQFYLITENDKWWGRGASRNGPTWFKQARSSPGTINLRVDGMMKPESCAVTL